MLQKIQTRTSRPSKIERSPCLAMARLLTGATRSTTVKQHKNMDLNHQVPLFNVFNSIMDESGPGEIQFACPVYNFPLKPMGPARAGTVDSSSDGAGHVVLEDDDCSTIHNGGRAKDPPSVTLPRNGKSCSTPRTVLPTLDHEFSPQVGTLGLISLEVLHTDPQAKCVAQNRPWPVDRLHAEPHCAHARSRIQFRKLP